MVTAAIDGLMMDDFPLSLNAIFDRVETGFGSVKVVSRRPDGSIDRTDMAGCCDRSRRLGTALRSLGIGRGDRVATLLWNQREHLELYFAVPCSGAVVHTLNPRLAKEELGQIVAAAEDRIIVVDESLLDVFEAFRDAWEFDWVIVVGHGGPTPAGALDYARLVADAAPGGFEPVDEKQGAAMCFTSGTTGRPKGVVYSHRALALHSIAICNPDAFGISPDDVVMPVVPMFHANAWGLPYAAALAGAALVLPGRHLDGPSLLELFTTEGVTFSAAVPTIWMAVQEALDGAPTSWDLSAVRELVIGGAALPEGLMRGLSAHGLKIVHAWGMTETTPVGTVCHMPAELRELPEEEQIEYRLRQGTPVPFVELRGRDDNDGLIAWDDREMGELEIRGPWIASAYLGGEGADKFTADGWFRTGDIVRIDHRGCIRICDRSKDLVKSGGEWISSVDLENSLMSHPDVAEAAVVATPDERWGERPLAVVVRRAGADVDAEALRAYLGERFAGWQVPDRFEYVDSIPRTATGKFKKTTLREQFVDQSPGRTQGRAVPKEEEHG